MLSAWSHCIFKFKSDFPLSRRFNQQLALGFSGAPVAFGGCTRAPLLQSPPAVCPHQEAQPWRELVRVARPLWLMPLLQHRAPRRHSLGPTPFPRGRSLICAYCIGVPENQTHIKPTAHYVFDSLPDVTSPPILSRKACSKLWWALPAESWVKFESVISFNSIMSPLPPPHTQALHLF